MNYRLVQAAQVFHTFLGVFSWLVLLWFVVSRGFPDFLWTIPLGIANSFFYESGERNLAKLFYSIHE